MHVIFENITIIIIVYQLVARYHAGIVMFSFGQSNLV